MEIVDCVSRDVWPRPRWRPVATPMQTCLAPARAPRPEARVVRAPLAGRGSVRYASASRDVPPALLTLATAILFGLSFPPVGAAPLAWVALVPFLVALARVPPRRAAGLALLLAPAGALGVTWWFPGMVSAYFGTAAVVGWLAWLVFCPPSLRPP